MQRDVYHKQKPQMKAKMSLIEKHVNTNSGIFCVLLLFCHISHRVVQSINETRKLTSVSLIYSIFPAPKKTMLLRTRTTESIVRHLASNRSVTTPRQSPALYAENGCLKFSFVF